MNPDDMLTLTWKPTGQPVETLNLYRVLGGVEGMVGALTDYVIQGKIEWFKLEDPS